MADQANNLRSLMMNKSSEPKEEKFSFSSRVITVTSGKGGVGKSNFTLNLAIELSKANKKVIVIDADFGLANIEVLMGAMPKNNLLDVIKGLKTITEVLSDGPNNIKYISGGSGLSQLADMSEQQIAFLIENFSLLDNMADIILIDTGAGISKQVIDLISASSETIIISTPEPTSITDAYAIIKTIHEKRGEDKPEINIIVNKVENNKEGDEIFQKLNRVSERFLSIHVNCLGYLPDDDFLVKAVKAQTPVTILYPASPFSKYIQNICWTVLNNNSNINQGENVGIKGFIKKFASFFKQ